MKTLCWGVFLWFGICNYTYATEVNVRYENKTYFLSAVFNVEATPARVMEVLTDFENLSDLNPAIIESEIQNSSKPDNLQVKTVVQDCVLFFCKSITRVEDIVQFGNEKLEALVLPLLSDLRFGYAEWVLTQHSSDTIVKYDASMQPKFWIPPVIRSYVLKKKLKRRIFESVKLLQQKAKE
jgi:hypothetical protein